MQNRVEYRSKLTGKQKCSFFIPDKGNSSVMDYSRPIGQLVQGVEHLSVRSAGEGYAELSITYGGGDHRDIRLPRHVIEAMMDAASFEVE